MPPQKPFPLTVLERAFSPETAASHHTTRLSKPLQIRATSPTPSARSTRRKALAERKISSKKTRKQQQQQQRPKPLSAAQKRALGLAEIPVAQRKYALYEPLHGLWCGYVREVLGVGGQSGSGGGYVSAMSGGGVLASADMHGAKVRVVRSRCVSRVGVEGIVVKETRGAFEIVCLGDCVKLIPKEHTVFRFEVPLLAPEGHGEVLKPLVFEIRGDQFQTRAPDRANKKFRMHYQPDL